VGSGAIRIARVRTEFEEHRYRTPYKFGGVPVDRATILNVTIDAIGPDGRRVQGYGAMPLGNVWSFPTRTLPYDVTLGAMKALATRIEAIVAGYQDQAHPLEIARQLEPEFMKAAVEEVARATKPDTEWKYCCDFNEHCPDVDYVIEFLRRVKEQSQACFDSIEYVEQPTSRNLRAVPKIDMHAANKLRPIVVDEALTDFESLLEARALGYTGLALKACKGQSHSVLFAAAARKYGMFLSVQDLTCPGAALVHSAAIAAWVPGTAGLEANARQYMPDANRPWAERLPGLFRITDGMLHTDCLAGRPGLGAVAS
jgi:hypothetical protein